MHSSDVQQSLAKRGNHTKPAILLMIQSGVRGSLHLGRLLSTCVYNKHAEQKREWGGSGPKVKVSPNNIYSTSPAPQHLQLGSSICNICQKHWVHDTHIIRSTRKCTSSSCECSNLTKGTSSLWAVNSFLSPIVVTVVKCICKMLRCQGSSNFLTYKSNFSGAFQMTKK